jgi:hypothetical protein
MEGVAAIAFSGKLTQNGGLPRPGTLTRIVEGLGRCDPAPIVEVSLDGAGPLGALLTAPMALGECADSADGLDLLVEFEFKSVERTSAKCSEPGVFSLDFSSEGVGPSTLLMPVGLSEPATGGMGICEVGWST